jgi:hypothetical protein
MKIVRKDENGATGGTELLLESRCDRELMWFVEVGSMLPYIQTAI